MRSLVGMSIDELKAFVEELRRDIAAQSRWTVAWAIGAVVALTVCLGLGAQLSVYAFKLSKVQKEACARGYGAYLPDEVGTPVFQWNDQSTQSSQKERHP